MAVSFSRSPFFRATISPGLVAALFFGLIAATAGCDADPARPQVRTGLMPVAGGRIWYHLSGKPGQPPLVLLHGGPGFPSYYLRPLLALNDERPVLMFDQLGCGRSDKVTDSNLYDLNVMAGQLTALLDSLGIDRCDLLGHSFGAALAAEFYKQHPDRVRSIIFVSPALNAARWSIDADSLIAGLPQPHRGVLQRKKSGLPVDTAAYNAAMSAYFGTYYDRTPSTAKDSSIRYANGAAANRMWGPEEFQVTGTFRTYDVAPILRSIRVPVLFECGALDAVRPATLRYYQQQTPGAKMAVIPGAGHSPMIDNPTADQATLRSFLHSLNNH